MDWIDTLIWISTYLGVVRFPGNNSDWSSIGWVQTQRGWELSAHNASVASECSSGSYLVLPSVIHASHEVLSDGRLVFVFGDPHKASPFYGQPAVPCALLSSGTTEWRVVSYTHFFARIPSWPAVAQSKPWQSVFYEALQSASAVALFSLGTFVAFVYGATRKLVLAFCLSAWSMALYFGLSTASLVNLDIRPITAHTIADISVWIGIISVFTLFRMRGLIHGILYAATWIASIIGCVVMLLSTTGDGVQLGTMIPFPVGLSAVAQVSYSAFVQFKRQPTKRRLAELLAAVVFVVSGGNEMLVVLGVFPKSPTFLQIGSVGMMMFLAMSLHEEFVGMIAEREMLKQHIKVRDLMLKMKELEMEIAELSPNKG